MSTPTDSVISIPQGVKERFNNMVEARTEVINRAERNALLTIPAIAPEEGHNETDELPDPWQSLGSRGVNNAASRVILTLFPPNTANWRGYIPDQVAVDGGLDPEDKAEFDAALSGLEQEWRRSFEASGDRAVLYEVLRHYLVTGNVLLRMLSNGRLRFYRIQQYAVDRDLDGNVLAIVIRETIHYSSLSDQVKAHIATHGQNKSKDTDKEKVEVYTVIEKQENGSWTEGQYVENVMVEGTEARYPADEDKLPWRVLRHSSIPGEAYGRAYTEDLLPDLRSLDSLTQSVVEGIAVMVKTILFIRPGSPIRAAQLQKAKNGDVLSGDANDITVFRIEKVADLQAALNMIDRLENRLAQQFLLNSSFQRQAERVTAEEIRFMAQELETALGGFYSRLTTDLQLWYVNARLNVMQKLGEAPKLPEGAVSTQVIGGIDAIGRGAELDNLRLFVQTLGEILGPQALSQIINSNDLVRRVAAALGIDTRTLVRSEGETQDIQDQAGADQLTNAVAPQIAGALAPGLVQGPPPTEGQ